MNKPLKPYTPKQALRLIFKRYRIAQDTRNRDMQAHCREFIRAHWRNRHKSNVIHLAM